MLLIADSGSTKTDWAYINSDNEIKHIQTIGLNPYYLSENEINKQIQYLKYRIKNQQIIKSLNHQIHFYGSGCGVGVKKDVIQRVLAGHYRNSAITVNTDILGAARALLCNEKGIACILGTGANSCFYDGNSIKDGVRSTGYIFGDEGSGSHLGKMLIQHYLKNSLPKNLIEAFDEQYKLKLSDILDKIYRQPFPNRFLASFSPFIIKYISEPFLKEMVDKCFMEFIDYYIKGYKDYRELKISLTGSVAYHFKDQIEDVFYKNGLEISLIVKSPIENLVEYHRGLLVASH
jgi:N-acetylglucosamine kinase-like BadF-type ATPase